MKKFKWLMIVLTVIVLIIGGRYLWIYRYNKHWIMGKTSSEVAERYGKFDHWAAKINDDGNYYDGRAMYITVKNKVYNPLDINCCQDEWFVIYFDSEGLAYKCDIKLSNLS